MCVSLEQSSYGPGPDDASAAQAAARRNPSAHPLADPLSGLAIDGDREGRTDLAHPSVRKSPKSLDEHPERHALDRIEVDCRALRDRILVRVQNDLARQQSDRSRAWCDQRSPKPRNSGIAREDNHRAPADCRQLAPPQFAATRGLAHDAEAARRNDARSPHASGSSSGWRSYAA